MAKSKLTKKDVTAAARKAANNVREKAGKALSSLKERLTAVSSKVKDTTKRKYIAGAEVIGGAAAAGAASGAGLDIGGEDGAMSWPVGLPAGLVLIFAGEGLKQPDVSAFGLGALAFGVGKVTETAVAKMIVESEQP